MISLRHKQTQKKLDELGFDQIAQRTGFDNGYTKKISAYSFLFGFFLMYNKGQNSLDSWATGIEQITGQVVSKQAVALKFEQRHVACFEELTAALLQPHLAQALHERSPLFDTFNRVLIEDSTCLGLHRSLSAEFPSTGEAATARLQLCYELKQEQILDVAVQSFRDNDQKHARQITTQIVPGDLVIRDLGYFSTGVFKEIAQAGGFFLSRLRYGVNLYDAQTGAQLDLLALGRGKKQFDMVVELGSEHRYRVRLVGLRLPETKAKQRRRKAKKDRHSKANHSAEYMAWLGWNFFVTNVADTCWSPVQLYHGYRLRWRIEILFKTLKSSLGFAKMLEEKKLSRARVLITIMLMLIFALLFLLPGYQYWSHRLARVSLLKYANWVRLYFEQLLQRAEWGEFWESVRRHCLYERRRKRLNFHELMLLE